MGWQDQPVDPKPAKKKGWQSAPEATPITAPETLKARPSRLERAFPSKRQKMEREDDARAQAMTQELRDRRTAAAPSVFDTAARTDRKRRDAQSAGSLSLAKPAPQPTFSEGLNPQDWQPHSRWSVDSVERRLRPNPGDTLEADGVGDRITTNVAKAGHSFGGGLRRFLSAGVVEPIEQMVGFKPGSHSGLYSTLVGDAQANERYVNTPIAGETTWNDVKQADGVLSTTARGAKFVTEQGPGSLANLILFMNPVGIGSYGASLAGSIGQDRAEANGEINASGSDLIAAAPAAAASLALERIGLKGSGLSRIGLGSIADATGRNAVSRIARAGAGEALTEYGQGAVEYAGGSVGTEQGFDPAVANDQGLAGAIIGGPFGGLGRSYVELGGPVPQPAYVPQPQEQVAQPEPAAWQQLSTPVADVAVQQPEPQPQPASEPVAKAPQAPAAPQVAPEPAPAPESAPAPEPAPKPAPVATQPAAEPAPAPAPKPEAQPAAGDAQTRPDPGPLGEGERLVRTPAGSTVRTKFEVVEASSLKQAEGANQNRDRSRDTTDMQVQDIVAKFDPELLGEDPSTDRGAPIIGEDGSIDSGNGRVLALNKIYDAYPDQASRYRAMIEARGFSTEGMDRPVLVQRRMTQMTPEQRRQFVIDSNKDTKLELSPVERARSDADSITPEMLASYAGGDLNATANAAFVQAFNKNLTAGEMGGMIGSDRRLTPDGQKRIENAVVAHAYGNPKLLERMMESSHDEIRSITGSLADVAGSWARMRADVKAGDIDQSLDITDELTDAAARVADARKRGIKPADLLTQQDAFDQIAPATAELIRAFHNPAMTRSASRKAVSALLRDYISAASEQQAGPGLFGEQEVASPASILRNLLEKRDNPNGDGFFESRQAPADASLAPDESAAGAPVDESRGYEKTHAEASFTNRQSVYDSAVRAVGLDADKFNILPPARKVALLSRALTKLTGVTVTLDKKIPLQHAIDQLLDAHQTLQGMASVMGIDPRALSLDGALQLQLVKSARFLGAFYSDRNLIRLPGRSNSFAHEWSHALDYHLLRTLSPSDARGLTGEIRNNGADFQPENVREAFVHLLNTMFFDRAGLAAKIMDLEAKIAATKSDKQRAELQAQIDRISAGNSQAREKSRYWRSANAVNKAGGDGSYWTRPTEMFARAFEAWIAFKTANVAFGNEFITKGDAAYSTPAASGFAEIYPQGEERMAIFDAMQKTIDVLNAQALLKRASGQTVTAREASGFDDVATPEMRAQADKSEARQRGLVSSLFGPDIEAWKIGRENAAIDEADAARRIKDPVKFVSKMNNARGLAFSAAADGVKMVAKRWNSKAVMAVHDHFAHDLGGTRRVDRVWAEAVTIRENKALNPIFKELEKHGSRGWIYKKLDAKQRDTLKLLLRGEPVADDLGMTRLASLMRRGWNDEWYHNKNAGIDLGYVKDTGYINRQIDAEMVAKDQDAFVEQATLAYELVFDRDIGEDAATIASDEKRSSGFLDIAKKNKIAGLKDLRKAIADDGDVEAVIEEMFDDVRNAFALGSATAYRDAILHTETFPDFTATATLPNYEKRRSLPAEADELLKDFYNPDPIAAFVQYVTSSVRRTEWARRFGADNAKGKALDAMMAREGVPEADRRYVWALVDRMAGRYRRTGFLANPSVASALSLLRVKGTLAMMGRAVTLSFFEPASLGIIASNPVHGMTAVAKTWANVLLRGSRAEMMEWARAQGFIKHYMLEQITASDRFGTHSDTPTRLDRLPSAMFRNSGLTFLTDASDAAVVDVGRRGVLMEMAHRVADGGTRGGEAEKLMRELGIRSPKEFAAEIVAMNGAMPSDEWLDGPLGWDYNTALIRLSKMVIQKPSPAELAPLGRNPLAAYATYSITAFLQASYRHLFKRQAKIAARLTVDAAKSRSPADLAQLAKFSTGTMMGIGLLYGLNLLSSLAREAIFNADRQDEWEKDGKFWQNNMALAASRTFSFGAADPMVNAVTGLKYNRDLAYLPLGAYAGNDAQHLSKMAKLFTTNSRKTNTAEHNALQGLYGFAIAPTLAAGFSSLPGGPFASAIGGAGTSTTTSPQAAKGFASMIVGEKQEPKERAPTGFDKLMERAFPTPPKEKK